MRLLIIICVLSFLSEAQDSMDTYNINKTYRSYLKKSFLTSSITPFVKRKQKEEPLKSIILGTIHKETGFFKFTKKKSFSVSSFGQSDKQMAAILFGTKYFSIYEFVADDYEKHTGSKDILMKEFLKIKIFIIPDTNFMKIKSKAKINTLETITEYSHNRLIHLKNPIIISFYSSYHETSKGMRKISKTMINHKEKLLYNSVQYGNKNILMHNSKMNEFLFLYKSPNKSKLISGGLMNHILTNLLCRIKNSIHLKAINVSKVLNIYDKKVLDLKRISDQGKLIFCDDLKIPGNFIH